MSALITIAVNQRWLLLGSAFDGSRPQHRSADCHRLGPRPRCLADQADADGSPRMDWVVGASAVAWTVGYRTAWRLRRASLTLPTEVTTVAQLSTESTTHSTSATLADGDGLSSQAVQPAAVEIEDASFLSPARTAATNRQPAAGPPKSKVSRATTSCIALCVGILHGIGWTEVCSQSSPRCSCLAFASCLYLGAFCASRRSPWAASRVSTARAPSLTNSLAQPADPQRFRRALRLYRRCVADMLGDGNARRGLRSGRD